MLGEKIRQTRQNKGLTLNDIAVKTQFTIGYLSQIERDMVDPSLSALRKIATALEIPMYFFLEDPEKKSVIIKSDKRLKLDLPDSNITYEFLTPMVSNQDVNPKMVMIYFHLNPKSWSSEESIIHNADECIVIMKGILDIYFSEEKHTLFEGDSIYIKENVPHKFYNPSETECVGISTISPAIY